MKTTAKNKIGTVSLQVNAQEWASMTKETRSALQELAFKAAAMMRNGTIKVSHKKAKEATP